MWYVACKPTQRLSAHSVPYLLFFAEVYKVTLSTLSNLLTYHAGAIYLVFSDRSTDHAYRYPYYNYFKDLLEPILLKTLGPDGLKKLVRLQFALMPPGRVIKMHRDMGGYAHKTHRIHVPIVTHPKVSFQVSYGMPRRGIVAESGTYSNFA